LVNNSDIMLLGFICNKKVYYQIIGDRYPDIVKLYNEFKSFKS
jgi:hypothetical protein